MVTSMPEPRRRTQAQRRDAARAALLDTAIGLLADGGYASMTLADVGERAGYSRSLAAHYFGSKPKLLAAIIDYVLTESPPPTLDPGLRGVGRIEAEITSFFDGLVSHPSWVRVYIVIAHEAATAVPELQAAIHQQNVGFRNRVESALREGIDLGEIPSGLDTGAVSIAVMAMVRGVAWEWFTDPALGLPACKRAILAQARALCTNKS